MTFVTPYPHPVIHIKTSLNRPIMGPVLTGPSREVIGLGKEDIFAGSLLLHGEDNTDRLGPK